MSRWVKQILIIGLCSVLAACGFHPRRASDVPAPLHTLHLQTRTPYNPLVTETTDMLKALDVKLVSLPTQANYTLRLDKINFHQSIPSITTTSLAVTLTYTLSVEVQLLDAKSHRIVIEKRLSSKRSISQNASQVYTPGTATLVIQALRRDIVSQLYYLLVSNKTRSGLHHESKA